MMLLPPGCTVTYEIQMSVDLSVDMIDWLLDIGAERDEQNRKIRYGQGRWSHNFNDFSNITILRFHGNDASIASMFILKFNESIISHNLNDMEKYVY